MINLNHLFSFFNNYFIIYMVIRMRKNIVIIFMLAIVSMFLVTGCGKDNEYYYTATKNDNMINYNVKIIDGENQKEEE